MTLLEITERAGTGSGRERGNVSAQSGGAGGLLTPPGLPLLLGSLLGTGGGTGTPCTACRASAMSSDTLGGFGRSPGVSRDPPTEPF